MNQWGLKLVGSRVKRDIVNQFGTIILPTGTMLTMDLIQKLADQDIFLQDRDVIYDSAAEEIRRGEQLVYEATQQIRELFHFINETNQVPVPDITHHIIPAVNQATANSNLFMLLSQIKSKDDYTYRHNIGVGVLSTLIGKWLQLNTEELELLTLAATLHDIGKTKIPEDILSKPGKLTDLEYELMKRHTLYGYELLRNTVGLPHRVALVALQHHEREDGRGYPHGLKGHEVDLFSKIVAVADIFHAMTSKRPYHDAIPFYQVLQQMRNGVFGELDYSIIKVFLDRIMGMMIGQTVTLTDGRHGRVVMINQHDPIKPLVKVDNGFLDLSSELNVNIVEVSP